ncbi:HNH endonuclease [Roseomonas marmotae]|uniref:HNH endonuclease n=1 Tax=Roseomonas marmotae TaxID=2768161 RepID=UPI001AD71D1B|nr:HNH endonuclease signature motif containing protein [Roseomonas marmotae]QTI79012.1 HNH endonuclease [Roseomonas marmotae]
MPWAAPRYCSKPGHPAFTGRRCPECEKIWDKAAGSASSRGYDRDWRKLREHVLAEEPLCRICTKEGRVTPATEVDHIQPLRFRPELRLVRSNVRPLCSPCHRAVTARFNRSKGIRGAKSKASASETAPPAPRATPPKLGFPGK